MKSKSMFAIGFLCLTLGGVSWAGNLTWEGGGFGDCAKICSDAGSRSVSSGRYSRTRQQYWICAGSFEGWRPGYNLETGNECVVPWGGKENPTTNKYCLCHQ